MNNALRFTILETAMQRPYLKTHLVPLVLVVAIIVGINPGPLGAISLCSALAMLAPASAFGLDERARLDTLYAVLPISRKNIVLGRYAGMLILAAALGLLGTVLSIAVTVVRSQAVDATQIAVICCASFLALSLVLGIQLPVYFALGHSRARILNYAILIALLGTFWLIFPALRMDLATITLDLNTPLFYLATIGGSVLIWACSVLVATRAYAKREL